MKFGQNKNKDRTKLKDETSKSIIIKPGDPIIDIMDDQKSVKTNSIQDGSFTNELIDNNVSGVDDPILYFKKLDQIINRVLNIIKLHL